MPRVLSYPNYIYAVGEGILSEKRNMYVVLAMLSLQGPTFCAHTCCYYWCCDFYYSYDYCGVLPVILQ